MGRVIASLPAMARSHRTGSRSDAGSVAGSQAAPAFFQNAPSQPVLKSRNLATAQLDRLVLDGLKGGGHHSACLRGGPLWLRQCQVCLDIARECKEGIYCKSLTSQIEAHLMDQNPASSDTAEMANVVFRFIKELAEKTEHIRAQQVMGTNLKPTEQRVLFFVKRHAEIVKKLGFLQQQVLASKSLLQVEAEVPLFLKEIKAECDRSDVAKLMDQFKLLEKFQPFLEKARTDAAEKVQKADMHGDSIIVDNYLDSFKFRGDRTFTRAFVLMSMKC